MSDVFTISPGKMTLADFQQIIKNNLQCRLDKKCIAKINASCDFVKTIVNKKQTVYGINTGFGSLANQIISPADLITLQRNIVLSHACGTGELLSDRVVALIMLMKINSLAQGFSGVRLQLIEALLALYNAGVFPCIPAKGSVGASGDLAPLAHMALPLIGEGEVRMQGKIIAATEGLKAAGLQALQLAPKEGLALLNGLQASCAMAMEALFVAEMLFETAVISGSLSIDAARASDVPFDARIQQARGYKAQMDIARKYLQLLQDSEIRNSHRQCTRVQDPYSLRCQPQIMGAVLHQIRFVNDTLQVEANAVSDNPLIFSEDKEILSGGNFHGEIIAMAADNLALAIAETGANAERRIALLIDKNFSGLPAFLVRESGLNSGFMIVHVTAAACASDNKALAHPHSVDSLPTSANQEDHVSMATNAARRLTPMNDNTATILAVEILAACQGLDLLAPLQTSPTLQKVYRLVRDKVAFYESDRNFAPGIASVKEMVLSGEIVQAIAAD